MVSRVQKVGAQSPVVRLAFGESAVCEWQRGVFLALYSEANQVAACAWIADEASVAARLRDLATILPTTSRAEIKMVGPSALRAFIGSKLSASNWTVRAQAEVSHPGEIQFFTQTWKLRLPVVPTGAKPIAPVGPRRVFLVDDSGTMRKVLRNIFESDPALMVCGETGMPTQAEAMIEQLKPDVITLDIHMPELDGISLLKRLHAKFSIPVVMVSSVDAKEAVTVLKCLELGAVDYIQKPSMNEIQAYRVEILEKIKAAAGANLRAASGTVPAAVPKQVFSSDLPIVIGSSTGGTEALKVVLQALPKNVPPILIVQHIPAVFSLAFANRLNELCAFEVREAKDGDPVIAGRAYIAPGGFHMTVQGRNGKWTLRVQDLPGGYTHKPSVDVLFDSALQAFGGECLAIILTGMGRDGAKGMKKLRDAGASTIAQDEKSCVVYGMPRAAVELGGAESIVPLGKIAEKMAQELTRKKKRAA